MIAALALLATLPFISGMTLNHDQIFADWKAQYGKSYGTPEEEALRFEVFKENAMKIVSHNSKNLGYTMALNQFADLTAEEFSARYVGGYRAVPRRPNPKATHLLRVNKSDIPSSVDWEAKGAVTPIKNQGQCGSCWAFSTTGSVEGITFITTGKLISLSEQQLVDCSGSYGNEGCNGGLMDNAFKYIIAEGGLCSESAYPYQGTDGTCKSSSCQKVATITGYQDVPTRNENAFKAAIAQQPVSIAVEADQTSFQFYSGGVMSQACGTNLDHGVLAVGYGSLNGDEYYKVKNSWGASWGLKGYILLSADSSLNGGAGQCGILLDPSYPENSN